MIRGSNDRMPKRTGDEEYATDAEVEVAIGALSDADAVRLGRAAKFRARMLAGLGLGIGAEDLLQDAITRTIAGDRRWRKKVSFVKHLIETMRSIASHAREELKGSQIDDIGDDCIGAPLGGVALTATFTSGLQVAAIHEQFDLISARFANDDEAMLVLECLANGQKGPDIQDELGITEQQFETIMTRVRRGVDRKGGWQP